jgi:hypothetical protein
MSSTTTTPERATRYARLRRFNLGVGLIHLAQGIVLLALANDLALPVLATFLADDPIRSSRPPRSSSSSCRSPCSSRCSSSSRRPITC